MIKGLYNYLYKQSEIAIKENEDDKGLYLKGFPLKVTRKQLEDLD